MTDKPLVSVIVPAFNAAGYVREALNSALTQTYPAIEVIVVDDGSSDDTTAIVKEFVARDSRVQLIQQNNLGVGAARNAAIRKARGKYIAPLDADDFWLPEKIEKQVTCMERGGDETGLVYCWATLVDREGWVLPRNRPESVEGRLRHAMLVRNVVDNGSVPLFRTAALEKVGLYLTRAEQGEGQGCEDWDIQLRVAEAFNVGVVPEYLVAYRQTNSSVSVNAERMAASYAVLIRHARQRNRNLPSAVFRWSAGGFYCYLAQKCYDCDHCRCCLRFLIRAVFIDPVLLLRTWNWIMLVRSLLNVVTGLKAKHTAEQFRLPPTAVGKSAEVRPRQDGKRPFILNRIFHGIELKRWSALLHDPAYN